LRLACQVTLKSPTEVRVPDELLDVREIECTVRSNTTVATFITELRLALPEGDPLDFRAGAFIQLHAPPFHARFSDFAVAPRYRAEWDRLDLWRHEASSDTPTARAYSLANYPGEGRELVLDVRIATPPPGAPSSIPPGVVSSYVFSLAPGDKVSVSGPFGHFFASDTDREMVFVGGGAGMAPMRALIVDQLVRVGSRRTISFWYGARSQRELFYVEEFDGLEAEHPNFRWVVALSEPGPEEGWTGPVGFIHDVLRKRYLENHPAPEDCEYYLCGPPLMLRAALSMLDELGVDPESIRSDDFGGS